MKSRDVVMVSATLMLAACTWVPEGPADASPTPQVTSAAPSVVEESPTPSVTPSPESTAEKPASLLDLNGRWCPTSPEDSGDRCVDISLPVLRFDGAAFEEYTYLPGKGTDTDPRTYGAEDFALAPTTGECWSMAIDGYPVTSGAFMYFCPAGAVSGEQWIDDPWSVFPAEWGTDPADIIDHRDEDRLYMGQAQNYFPYVREVS